MGKPGMLYVRYSSSYTTQLYNHHRIVADSSKIRGTCRWLLWHSARFYKIQFRQGLRPGPHWERTTFLIFP